MKISIIIPVLNEETNLARLSDHLQTLAQLHEIIIVDGGSRDNTLSVAYQLTDKVIVSHPGRAVQMNSGAEIASGEVLLFLHADTFLPEDGLQIISALSSEKNVWGRFDVRLSGKRFVFRLIEALMNLRSCVTAIATGDQAIFIERNLFQHVGGFPEIALMEDIEISRRLKKIVKPLCIKQKVITSSRRWEKNGVVATVLLMWKLRLYYFFGMSPEKLKQLY